MNDNVKMVKCFGCGGWVADVEGATHRYMLSAPGCWVVYGELLARSYEKFQFPGVHQVMVDAYAVQHPGENNPQAIHSVALHLIRLYSVYEAGFSLEQAARIMLNSANFKKEYTWLEPPDDMGKITVVDAGKAGTLAEFEKIVTAWGLSAWQAWGKHHASIRKWAKL